MIFDEKLMFYKVKPLGPQKRFFPVLENTIYNYMKCS